MCGQLRHATNVIAVLDGHPDTHAVVHKQQLTAGREHPSNFLSSISYNNTRHHNVRILSPPILTDRFGRGGRHDDYDDGPGGYGGRPMGPGHQPTRPVDKDKTEAELSLNIKKATSPEETAPSA